jgi:hypothetical protein
VQYARVNDARAIALASTQDGAITVQQAYACGLTDDALRHRVKGAGWTQPFRGVLLVPPVPNPLRARARAAQLLLPDSAVISHVTAGRLQEMDGLPLARLNEPIWVTRQLADTAAQRRGLVQRWSDIAPDDIVDLDGLRVTSVGRTAIDLALHANRLDAVCFMESAMRLGVSIDQLQHLARGRRGKRRLAPWWELADVRSENPLETKVRLHLIDADLAPDELQYEVRVGNQSLFLDMAYKYHRVGVETDGRDPHLARQQFVWDRRKWMLLAEADWTLVHLTWADARSKPYVVQTVRRALARAERGLSDGPAVEA